MAILNGTSADETIKGTRNADTISGLSGDDKLVGRGGDDILSGGAGNDRLFGGNGDDALRGGEGNDKLKGGNGDDFLSGGEGNDRIVGGAGNDRLDGGEGNDIAIFSGNLADYKNVLDIATGTWTLEDMRGIDGVDSFSNIEKFRFADQVITAAELFLLTTIERVGTEADDVVSGSLQMDHLFGLAGDDVLDAMQGNDILEGGAGNDRLIGGVGDDIIDGGEGHDVAVFNAERDDYLITELENGSYQVEYIGGAPTGFSGTDIVSNVESFEFADQTLSAGELINGPDIPFNVINGTNADDFLFGTDDADLIETFDGNDFVSAGNGDDRLVGGSGVDQLDGGEGSDTTVLEGDLAEYDFYVASPQIALPLDGEIRFTRIDADGNAEGVYAKNIEFFEFGDITMTRTELLNHYGVGTVEDDNIFGTSGLDIINTFDGNDRIDAGDGSDLVFAGTGNDVLIGGKGSDVLNGGAGNDIFEFAESDFTLDTTVTDFISDFVVGEDMIQLSNVGFDGLVITQEGDHTVISIDFEGDASGVIRLNNFDATTISESDFMFG